jgi:ElaB/YqjD/DUF883 family membrane-anchored ribosome-binding protein
MNARKAGTAETQGEQDTVAESWDKLAAQLERLHQDLSNLKGAAADLAKAGSAEGRERILAEIEELAGRVSGLSEELETRGHRAAKRAGEQIGSLGRELEDAINRNPLAAVLIAVGMGFLIGKAMRGRN